MILVMLCIRRVVMITLEHNAYAFAVGVRVGVGVGMESTKNNNYVVNILLILGPYCLYNCMSGCHLA